MVVKGNHLILLSGMQLEKRGQSGKSNTVMTGWREKTFFGGEDFKDHFIWATCAMSLMRQWPELEVISDCLAMHREPWGGRKDDWSNLCKV